MNITTDASRSIDAARATQVVDRSFAAFDTAREGDASQADGKISIEDLQAVVANVDGRFSRDDVQTALFLLTSTAARSFLDVGAGRGDVDGTISRDDVDGALATIASGGLDAALLDTAAGQGSADGYVGGIDLQAAQSDPGIPDGLRDMLSNLPPGLPLQTQLRAAFALRATADDPAAQIQLPYLIASPAFRGLDEAQQAQALALFGSGTAVSEHALTDLLDVSAIGLEPKVDLDSTASLQAYLLSVATPVDAWRDAYPASGIPDDRRRDYSYPETPGRTSGPFPSGDLPNADVVLFADAYYVDVEGQTIEVLFPRADQFDARGYAYPTIEQVAKALAAQPAVSLENIDRVVVNPYTPLEQDPATGAITKSDAGAYYSGDSGTISINPAPAGTPSTQASLDFTIAHEVGHAVAQPGRIYGVALEWSLAVQSDRLFPTEYSDDNYVAGAENLYDPTEDFAEAYMIYQLVKGTPDEAQMRALMPERFAALDRMFG